MKTIWVVVDSFLTEMAKSLRHKRYSGRAAHQVLGQREDCARAARYATSSVEVESGCGMGASTSALTDAHKDPQAFERATLLFTNIFAPVTVLRVGLLAKESAVGRSNVEAAQVARGTVPVPGPTKPHMYRISFSSFSMQQSIQATPSAPVANIPEIHALIESIIKSSEGIRSSSISTVCDYLRKELRIVRTFLELPDLQAPGKELEALNQALLDAQRTVEPIAQLNLLMQAFARRRLALSIIEVTSPIRKARHAISDTVREIQSSKKSQRSADFPLRFYLVPRVLDLSDVQVRRKLRPLSGEEQEYDIEEYHARYAGEEREMLLRHAKTAQGREDINWHIDLLKALEDSHIFSSDASLLLGYSHYEKSYALSFPSEALLKSNIRNKSYIDRLLLAIPYTLTIQRLQCLPEQQGPIADPKMRSDARSEGTIVDPSASPTVNAASGTGATNDMSDRERKTTPQSDKINQLLRLLLSDTASMADETSNKVSSEKVIDAMSSLETAFMQSVIDHLNNILSRLSPSSGMHAVTSRILQKLCVRMEALPKILHLIEAEIHKTSDKPLGHGGFATVYLGQYRELAVALKCYYIADKTRAQAIYEIFCKEALQWRRLQHKNITPFLGVTTVISPLCLVSKWMTNGTIISSLQNNPDLDRVPLLVDIAKGLEYLHSSQFVHGDLKGGNILIDEHSHACLCDFGVATVMYDPQIMQSVTKTGQSDGTTRWQAPERLDPEEFGNDPDYEPFTSDIYSLSMVVWEIFAGEIPFLEFQYEGTVINQVLNKGKRPSRTEDMIKLGLTDDIWAIVEEGWRTNWRERPPLDRILDVFTHAATSRSVSAR